MILNIDSFFENIAKNNLIENNDRIICGLSGGKDSVALLYLLNELKSKIDFEIKAIHINHCIRGAEADRDEAFCNKLCKKLKIAFDTISIDVPKYAENNKLGIEEAARKLRYDAFNKIAKEDKYNKIAVAHSLSDQAETVLFRIIRGTGIKGLIGMKPKNGNIIRPLLPFSTDEIKGYLELNSIEYVYDSSNSDSDYSRNRIRNIILPEIKKINDKAELSLFRLANYAGEDENYIQSKADEIIDPSISDLQNLLKNKTNYPLLYRYLFNLCEQKEVFLDSERFNAVIELIKKNKTDIIIQIEKGYSFRIIGNKLKLLKGFDQEIKEINKTFLNIGRNEIPNSDIIIEISKSITQNNKIINKKLLKISTSLCKIEGDIFIRSFDKNDTINMYSMHKNVSKMISDAKIPKELRKAIPVICDSKEIIWVPFFGLCDKVRITPETKQTLEFSIESDILNKIKQII